MHADAFDRYHEAGSILHRLDPRVKVVVTLAFILSNVLLPDGAWLAFALAWVNILALNLLSGLGLGFTFRRSFVALPFALAAATAIFSIPGTPLAEWHLGSLKLIPTDAGLLRFISIVIRSWLSLQAAILLVAVTRFPDLIHAFEHLRVPSILTTIVAFLYRYLFVLTNEVMRLLRARQARSAAEPGRRPGRSVLWRGHVAGNMAGQLFLRSYERSDRIYNAMLARGYDGHLLTLNAHTLRTRDWLWAVGVFALLLLTQWIGRL
ncbi:MAG TPA: cobalt ECF transporter T component CbiQ [Anaerolineales bacterium]